MKPWTRIISARGRGRRGHALFFVKSTDDITTNESNDLSIKIQKRYLQPKQNSIQKCELTEPWFFLVELNLVVWKEEKMLFIYLFLPYKICFYIFLFKVKVMMSQEILF